MKYFALVNEMLLLIIVMRYKVLLDKSYREDVYGIFFISTSKHLQYFTCHTSFFVLLLVILYKLIICKHCRSAMVIVKHENKGITK